MSDLQAETKKTLVASCRHHLGYLSNKMKNSEKEFQNCPEERPRIISYFRGLKLARDLVAKIFTKLNQIDPYSWENFDELMETITDQQMETWKSKNWDPDFTISPASDALSTIEMHTKFFDLIRARLYLRQTGKNMNFDPADNQNSEKHHFYIGNQIAKIGLSILSEDIFETLKRREDLKISDRRGMNDFLNKVDQSEVIKNELRKYIETLQAKHSEVTQDVDAIKIEQSVYQNFLQYANQNKPIMSCGFLFGQNNTVREFFPVKNRRDSETEFALSLEGIMEAIKKQKQHPGQELVGTIYNKNDPEASSYPNRELIQTADPEMIYFIVTIKEGRNELRAFRIDDEVRELECQLVTK